jgi:hypothetical protein
MRHAMITRIVPKAVPSGTPGAGMMAGIAMATSSRPPARSPSALTRSHRRGSGGSDCSRAATISEAACGLLQVIALNLVKQWLFARMNDGRQVRKSWVWPLHGAVSVAGNPSANRSARKRPGIGDLHIVPNLESGGICYRMAERHMALQPHVRPISGPAMGGARRSPKATNCPV